VGDAAFRQSKNLILFVAAVKIRGGARGGSARLEWDQIPRKALYRKACGEQREDFCAAQQHENQVLVQAVKEVQMDFFDSLKRRLSAAVRFVLPAILIAAILLLGFRSNQTASLFMLPPA